MRRIISLLVIFTIIFSFAFGGLEDEKKISLNLNTSLENSFNILSKVAKINIFLDDTVQKGKPVTLQIDGLTIKETLDIMLKLNALRMEKINENSIIVFPQERDKQYTTNETRTFYLKNGDVKDIGNLLMVTLGTGKIYINAAMNSITINASYNDMEEVKKVIEDNDKDELFIQKTFFLSYLKPDDAVDVLTKMKQKVKFSVNKTLNSVTVTLKKNEVEDVEQLIKSLDIKPSQVVIEIVLMDATSDITKEFGFSWDNANNISSDTISGAKWSSIFIPNTFKMSEMKNVADILSNPTVRVVNSEIAKISIGERVPIVIAKPTGAQGGSDKVMTAPSVEYKDVGIQMEVSPMVHIDSEVTIKLNLEVSSIGGYKSFGDYSYPNLISKNVSTTIRLKDGETAILGGLISNEERATKTTFPLIGDIPVLGDLFAMHNKMPKKSEIVMLLTPHIININSKDKIIDLNNTKVERSEKTKKLIEQIEDKKVKTAEVK